MFYKNRTKFIIDNINWKKENKILDVGFIGAYRDSFIHNAIVSKLKNNDELVGIDTSYKIKDFKNKDNIKYLKESVFNLDNNEENISKFDYIIFCEVFEHLENPYKTLHIFKKLLKKGGVLLITYPNPISWKKLIRYIFTNNIVEEKFLSLYAGDPEHKIFPYPPSIVNYLNSIEFEVKEVSFLKNFLSYLKYFNKFSSYIGIVAKKN